MSALNTLALLDTSALATPAADLSLLEAPIDDNDLVYAKALVQPSSAKKLFKISDVAEDHPASVVIESAPGKDVIRFAGPAIKWDETSLVVVDERVPDYKAKPLPTHNIRTLKKWKTYIKTALSEKFGTAVESVWTDMISPFGPLSEEVMNGDDILLEHFSVTRTDYSHRWFERTVKFTNQVLSDRGETKDLNRSIILPEFKVKVKFICLFTRQEQGRYLTVNSHAERTDIYGGKLGRPNRTDIPAMIPDLVDIAVETRRITETSLANGLARKHGLEAYHLYHGEAHRHVRTFLEYSEAASDDGTVSTRASEAGTFLAGMSAAQSAGMVTIGATGVTLLAASGLGLAIIALGYAYYASYKQDVANTEAIDAMESYEKAIDELLDIALSKASTGSIVMALG